MGADKNAKKAVKSSEDAEAKMQKFIRSDQKYIALQKNDLDNSQKTAEEGEAIARGANNAYTQTTKQSEGWLRTVAQQSKIVHQKLGALLGQTTLAVAKRNALKRQEIGQKLLLKKQTKLQK